MRMQQLQQHAEQRFLDHKKEQLQLLVAEYDAQNQEFINQAMDLRDESVNISIQGYNQSLDLWRNSNPERPRICENRYGMVKLALKSIRNAIVRRDDYIKQSSIIYSDKLN